MIKTHKLLVPLALMLLLASCATINHQKYGKYIRGDSGTVTQIAESSAKTDRNQSKATAQKPKNKTTSRKQETASSTTTLANAMQGEWTIVTAGKYTIEQDDDMPYIYFDEKDNHFYASNGCNVINGSFEYIDNDGLKFSSTLSTVRDCPDLKYTSSISNILKDGEKVRVQIEQIGKETYAYFLSKTNSKIMTLRRHNMEVLNGKWLVIEIEGLKIHDDEVNLFIDIPEHTVHGNTGCNYFNGEIMIDPAVSNSISFSQMAVTMRLCHNSDIEMAMLVALEQTATYSLSGNTLRFHNEKGKTIMILKRDK